MSLTRDSRRARFPIDALRTPGVLFGLVLAALSFHWPAVSSGLIPIEDDVRVFYFPLLVATKEALARVTLPLWTPAMFGGYPLFADGEAGALYPLHLLVLTWLTPEASLVVLMLVHSWLASVFTYGLIRTLGGGRLGGIVGGLCYAYSGFATGQIIHVNVFHALVWLPLELTLVERALHSGGAARHRYAVLAGAVFGVQALASHMQVTLMSGLAIAAFLAYRGLFERREVDLAAGSRLRTSVALTLRAASSSLARATAIFAIVGTIGVSLGAVQLFPLYELGMQTDRGGGVDMPLAAINSIWPGDLLTLLLPRLHDTAQGGFWGPWVRWETMLYVGIMPLALAAVALCVRSGRYPLFFGGLAFMALLIVLGPNAPLPLWSRLHELPAFEVLRSPGRYSLLFSLCVAVLAGYGADWLWRRTRPAPIGAIAVFLLGGAGALALALALDRASAELRDPSADTLAFLHDYVGLPGIPALVDGLPVSVERVRAFAAEAVAPTNPATAWQLALLGAVLLILVFWLLTGYLRRAGLPVRGALAAATIAIVAADLWVVGLTSHPLSQLSELRPHVPPVLLTGSSEPYRVYTQPPIDEKSTQVEPNRLLTAGVQEANGYSSLEPDRHATYVAAVEYNDGQLLDLWNARYVVRRVRPELLPSMGGTSFHPERPIFSSKPQAAAAAGGLVPEGGHARASEVRVIAALWDSERAPNGSQVARILLKGSDGSTRELPLLAGRDVADSRLNVPGLGSAAQHVSPNVAFQYPRENSRSPRFGEQLYYARLAVDPPLEVTLVGVEPSISDGGIEVYGLGVVDPASGEVTQARAKAKYRQVYRDEQIRIYENGSAMPRAFLVGQAVVARHEQDALRWLREGAVDARRAAILEEPLPSGFVLPTPDSQLDLAIGEASISSYQNESVVVRTSSAKDGILVVADPYYPGWVARVDGRETPIARADYLFRAVAVPAGTHTVTFSFEPITVALGGALTLLGALAVCAVVGLRALEVVRERLSRRAPRPHPMREPVYASADVTGGLEG